jgi:hypothetical protein
LDLVKCTLDDAKGVKSYIVLHESIVNFVKNVEKYQDIILGKNIKVNKWKKK